MYVIKWSSFETDDYGQDRLKQNRIESYLDQAAKETIAKEMVKYARAMHANFAWNLECCWSWDEMPF